MKAEFVMSFPQALAFVIGVGSYAHESHLNVPITAAEAYEVAAVLDRPSVV